MCKNNYEEKLNILYKAKEYFNKGEMPINFINITVRDYDTVVCTIGDEKLFPPSLSFNHIMEAIDNRILQYESLLEKEKNYQEVEEYLKDELKWLYKFGKNKGVEKEDIDNIICSYIEQRRQK